jgi:hypothetical protein
MKKILFLTISLVFSAVVYGQGAFDALRFSQYRYEGSARSMAMGNAFTSLGGDSYSISINPASSAIYKYSEFTFTPSLFNSSSESLYLDNRESEKWTRAGVSNAGFVVPFNISLSPYGLKAITFGVAINKLNNYTNRSYSFGVNQESSWLGSLAEGLTGINNINLDITDDWNPFYDYPGASWREILAWNSNLLDPLSDNEYIGATENLDGDLIYLAGDLNQEYFREQSGSLSEVVFNMGANISDRFFFGANLGLQSIEFNDYQKYSERAINPNLFDSYFSDFSHTYRQTSSGVGINLKAGFIAIPFDGLRVGASISTPTWMYIKDTWDEIINARYSDGYSSEILSPVGEYNYRINTPFRWNIGGSYVFGKIGLVSIDYEGANYSSIIMMTEDGNEREFNNENAYIKDAYQSAYTLRAGAEIRPVPGIALRAGYTKYGNPEKNIGYESQFISGGAGFSGKSGMFLDIAFQKRLADTEYYSFYQDYTNHPAPIGSHDLTGWKLLMTIGLRF